MTDLRRLLAAAEANGWTITKTRRNGHYKLTKPGCQPQHISSTPSDIRSLANIKARLRRAERNAR